jgi:hypothetical protein
MISFLWMEKVLNQQTLNMYRGNIKSMSGRSTKSSLIATQVGRATGNSSQSIQAEIMGRTKASDVTPC